MDSADDDDFPVEHGDRGVGKAFWHRRTWRPSVCGWVVRLNPVHGVQARRCPEPADEIDAPSKCRGATAAAGTGETCWRWRDPPGCCDVVDLDAVGRQSGRAAQLTARRDLLAATEHVETIASDSGSSS